MLFRSLFAKKPFHEISVAEIAARADVAHGLLFHYFGTKAKLYEVVSQTEADHLNSIQAAKSGGGSPEAKLVAFLKAHIDEVYRRRLDFVFHLQGAGPSDVQVIWEQSRQTSIRLILGFFGVDSPSPELVLAVRAWLGFVDQLVLAWVQGKTGSKSAIINAATRLFPVAIKSAVGLGARDVPRMKAEFPLVD